MFLLVTSLTLLFSHLNLASPIGLHNHTLLIRTLQVNNLPLRGLGVYQAFFCQCFIVCFENIQYFSGKMTLTPLDACKSAKHASCLLYWLKLSPPWRGREFDTSYPVLLLACFVTNKPLPCPLLSHRVPKWLISHPFLPEMISWYLYCDPLHQCTRIWFNSLSLL